MDALYGREGSCSLRRRPLIWFALAVFAVGVLVAVPVALATSPGLQALISAYPTGTISIGDPNIVEVSSQGINSVREDSGMVRFDHRFTSNTSMFARYNIDDAFIDKPNGALGSRDTTSIRPSKRRGLRQQTRLLRVSYLHAIPLHGSFHYSILVFRTHGSCPPPTHQSR